ncbi:MULTISPECIES: hypothetical protein [unclassified Arthrobacter]|uniref:hypothetical protein n=1 Tax=unclassified Arthrobacter TaxID=235627 RepID=UPI002E012D29|nr:MULTISPECIES: hypothetical protein [unclassified Arthrobacter]MEC5189764.1 hypothetical protein [Arthrobacter sp. MP_M4]MEC5201231.1 hypothetical protein [Arthrobacter sp. MP_M7]
MTADPLATPSAVHPTVAKAFQALEATGVPWVLLRGEDDLLQPSGDVDILVAPDLLPDLDRVMNGIGLCRVHATGHGSHRFYFGYSESGELWLKLDFVTEISFGPFQQWQTPLAPGCLARRIRKGDLWLPAPADQAWLQLLHLLLDKGSIEPQRQETARAAAAVVTPEDVIARYVDGRSGAGTSARILGLVRSGRFGGAPGMAAGLRSGWTAGGPLRTHGLALRNRAMRQLSPRLRGRGLVVGVMAPDGAGKTTLLNGLRGEFPIPTAYVYMGLWGAGPWDGWLHRVPGGRTAKKMYRVLKGGTAARYHRARGRVVLMDRVAYDVLLPSAAPGKTKSSVSDSLAVRLAAAPDLLLVLDVPGEVMFSRKGEHTAEILEGWRQSYLQLADRLPGSRILDAAQPQHVVQAQATQTVWGSMCPGTAGELPEDAAALSLHLWRLLDWRFLVPVLQPRNVGYGGAVGADLLAALHLLDPDAVRIPLGGEGIAADAFDVVLLREPDLQLFGNAASAVEPGGWMCAQVKRSFLRRSGPRTLAGWKRTFKRRGFDDVSVHWNATTLDSPGRLVPTASGTAVLDTLSLHKGVRFGLAKAVMARLALMLRLFDAAVPEGTVTGRRPGT